MWIARNLLIFRKKDHICNENRIFNLGTYSLVSGTRNKINNLTQWPGHVENKQNIFINNYTAYNLVLDIGTWKDIGLEKFICTPGPYFLLNECLLTIPNNPKLTTNLTNINNSKGLLVNWVAMGLSIIQRACLWTE